MSEAGTSSVWYELEAEPMAGTKVISPFVGPRACSRARTGVNLALSSREC